MRGDDHLTHARYSQHGCPGTPRVVEQSGQASLGSGQLVRAIEGSCPLLPAASMASQSCSRSCRHLLRAAYCGCLAQRNRGVDQSFTGFEQWRWHIGRFRGVTASCSRTAMEKTSLITALQLHRHRHSTRAITGHIPPANISVQLSVTRIWANLLPYSDSTCNCSTPTH